MTQLSRILVELVENTTAITITWQLTIIHKGRTRGSDTLFCPPLALNTHGAHTYTYIHTYRQVCIHIKIKKS